jgi:hypothetical protein
MSDAVNALLQADPELIGQLTSILAVLVSGFALYVVLVAVRKNRRW